MIELIGIPKTQFKLLSKIFNNRHLFNRQDNTFTCSNREMARHLGISPSPIDRLIRTLKAQDLVRKVTTITGGQLMLSPAYLKANSMEHGRYWFAKAMYHLKYHTKAIKWYDDCCHIGAIIDPETGEILTNIGLFERLSNELLRSRQYKHRDINYKVNLPQGYNHTDTPITNPPYIKIKAK